MIQKQQALQISIDGSNPDQQNNQNKSNLQSSQPAKGNKKSFSNSIIIGTCQKFISKNQIKSRQLNQFQKPTKKYKNWQPLACHFRNIQYTKQNVRTKQTLIQCLDFICNEYLPYYRQIFSQEAQRKKLQLFLYDRVRSIRCQFYVQNIFQPEPMIKLLKLILFLEIMIGDQVQLSILQQFLNEKDKLLANQNTKKYYLQALQFSIFWYKKQSLIILLQKHIEQIQENQHLVNLLATKLKIISNNYQIFLITLMSDEINIFTRLILWSQMKHIKQLIIQMYMKARMKQKASRLCRILGYHEMQGWIDISKKQDYQKLEKNKTKFDLQILLWINEDQLFEALQNLQSNQQKYNIKQEKQLKQEAW